MQLPALLHEPPDNVRRHGPASGCTVERKGPCTLSYVHGGVRRSDTLAGGILAHVWPSDTATLLDLTISKYVTFVLPANGGTITQVWCCKEADFQAIWEAQDTVPLEEVHLHYVRRWQIRMHPCPPISAPISYLWTTGLGLLSSTDSAHVAWTQPANTGLAGTAVRGPGFSFPTGGVSFGNDCTGMLVESSSQLALSYQDISRLWCVCGTGAGSTPTHVYQSNDNGQHWTQLTLPILSGTFAMVMGVAVDVCENLYVTVAHGPGYGNVLSVLSAAKPYTSWRITQLVDLTNSTWVGYTATHINEDGVITGAPVACDPLLPGRVVVGGCWVTPAWGWSATFVAQNGLAGSPTYTSAPIGGEAGDTQSQQYLSLDAWQGGWHGAWTQASAVLWHLSGTFATAGPNVDAWPNYGHNGQWNTLALRAAQSRLDRRSGYAATIIAAPQDDDATYSEAAILEKIGSAPAIVKHVLYTDHLQTLNELDTETGTYGMEVNGHFLVSDHKNVPSTRRARGNGTLLEGYEGYTGDILTTPVCDYKDERSVVGCWIGPDAAGTVRQVHIYTFSEGLHADDAVTISVPTVAGVALTPGDVGSPWALRCRNNNLTTPAASGILPSAAPALLAPLGTTNLDPYTALASWAAVSDPHVTHYEVQASHDHTFATDVAFWVTSDGTSTPFYSDLISTAARGAHYYWRVRAMAHSTPGPWSASGDFTVGYPPPVVLGPDDLAVFHLADVGGGVLAVEVDFSYVQVDGCFAIELQYGQEFDWIHNGGESAMSLQQFEDPPHPTFLTLNYTNYTTPVGGIRWRLRAVGPNGNGAWSAWRHFSITL